MGLEGHLTYKEIARKLSIKDSTVKSHLKTALEKLHLSSRYQLMVWLRTGNLTDPLVQPLLDL